MSENTAADRLLIIARGASRRHEDALSALDDAEREKRIAWENYDAYVGKHSTSKGVE
jgi:hypothetical protein